MSGSVGPLEPHPKYLFSRAEAITKTGAIVDALLPPCEHSLGVDKASQITTVIFEALQTQCPAVDIDHSLCSNSRLKPNHKYLLSKPEAIEKLETIIDVLQPPRRGGPNVSHVVDIIAQIFKDLQTQVPEVSYDHSWAAMGRRRIYCMLAGKEIWLPSLAEIANVEEGVYPYVEVFESQLWETRFPEKEGNIWTLPLEEAFLRAVCDDLANEDGSWNFHREPGQKASLPGPNQVLTDYIREYTGIDLGSQAVGSHRMIMGRYWRKLEELDALRNMDALFREYDTSSEEDGNDGNDSNGKEDEGYGS
ncbi:MAG: hypothetical protein Q9213_007825 [Squamulea squamosa]